MPVTASNNFIIGTAGHVDHGKSTLVRALTGIDPDRLKEEKRRQMTIELGFAWLDLPNGTRAGIVDVPGHERFIKNMLAGAGGIDLVLLVIAADEGPMPQTREHLAIVDLLGVKQGVVALTKADLVDDEMIELVSDEVGELLAPTGLSGAQVVPVAATTGDGLHRLVEAIVTVESASARAHARGPARLPIDRVFTMQGFGTVVTGTVLGGSLRVGDDVTIFPAGLATRIRGIQSHNASVQTIEAGNRTAINIATLGVGEIVRGDILARAHSITVTDLIDCRIRMLAESPIALEQNTQLDLFTGSAEVPAWPTLLDKESISPGGDGLVQLRLARPVAIVRGDKMVIRRSSPSNTIGGGGILDPKPRRHKRFSRDVIEKLRTLESGTTVDRVLDLVQHEPNRAEQLIKALSPDESATDVSQAISDLLDRGSLILIGADVEAHDVVDGEGILATPDWLERFQRTSRDMLRTFHANHPLRKGMPREELRRRLKISQSVFDSVLSDANSTNVLQTDGRVVWSFGFSIALDVPQAQRADAFLAALRANPFMPPAPSEFGVDNDLLAAMDELGLAAIVSDGMAFDPASVESMRQTVINWLSDNETMTLAQFRDMVGTSRKFAQAVLEYFDQQHLTRRVDDARRLYSKSR